MRGAVRLASISKARVIYSWTHDSVGVGEDGPTHQPIEHIAALRAMPGLRVVRPGDANETASAWRMALVHDGPTALILSRQNVPVLEGTGAPDTVERGAYVARQRRRPAVGLDRHRQRGRTCASVPPVDCAKPDCEYASYRCRAGTCSKSSPSPTASPCFRRRCRRCRSRPRARSDGTATRTQPSASTASARRRPGGLALEKLGINVDECRRQARALLGNR